MLNELKIKEKILKIIGGDSDYEYYPKVADEIYQLFLPALTDLVRLGTAEGCGLYSLDQLNGD